MKMWFHSFTVGTLGDGVVVKQGFFRIRSFCQAVSETGSVVSGVACDKRERWNVERMGREDVSEHSRFVCLDRSSHLNAKRDSTVKMDELIPTDSSCMVPQSQFIYFFLQRWLFYAEALTEWSWPCCIFFCLGSWCVEKKNTYVL